MSVVIKVENLYKQYRLGEVSTGSMKDDIKRWRYKMMGWEDPFLIIGEENDQTAKANSKYVWALKDINFEVQQGEILGIIGKNGAGKSTLLKILSRTTGPTKGSIKMKGRIASLLEVGTGFHGELSGRENIYLNGAIMGMNKAEIKSKLDEIIDFAGVEKYIDTPVKRYSSGMYVRLAFGVAAHLEPDIMIVDEVLAVGDAEFQKKALGKMKEVSGRAGRTVIFVSHNIGSILMLCDKGVVLDKGKNIFYGPAVTAANLYFKDHASYKNGKYINLHPAKTDIISITLVDENNNDKQEFTTDEDIYLRFSFQTELEHRNSKLLLRIKDRENRIVFSSNFDMNQIYNGNDVYDIRVKINKKYLVPGVYNAIIGMHYPMVRWVFQNDLVSFDILESNSDFAIYLGHDYGCVFPNCSWLI